MVPATLSPSAVRAATRGMEPWVERRSFPPPFPCCLLGFGGQGGRLLLEDYPRRRLVLQQLRTLPPAEGEGAAHHLPVASYGYVLPNLVVCPSQRVLHLLVALLDPVPQGVEPHHLRQVRFLKVAVLGPF